MEEEKIRIRCSLTVKNYREYMLFHVFARNLDWLWHLILVLLTLAFALVNFKVESAILGWLFSILAGYLLLSRYLRFYLSLRRNIRQFELTENPKLFYTITFGTGDFSVENGKESLKYPISRIQKFYFLNKKEIAYMFVSDQQAFLLPYASFETGSADELRKLLGESGIDGAISDK